MTVPTSDNREQYQGNDSATEFDYAFKIFRADDLVVVLTESDGTETTLTRGTDYSVDGVGNENGGSVIYPLSGDPLATGETLTILREIPVVQETDLRNQGAYYPETLEDEFDRSRMIDQQQQEQLDRTLSRTRASDYFDAKGRRIANVGNATEPQDALTKGQSDARFANDVITQTGGHWDAKGKRLTKLQGPVAPDDAATRGFVDNRFENDVITRANGHWDAELQQIRNLKTRQPPSSTDAMNFGAVSKHVSDVLNEADPQVDGWQRVRWVNTIADLQALPPGELVDGQQVQVKEYHAGTGVGGGEFYWDATSTEDDNGGTVFGDAAQGRWKRHYDVHLSPFQFGAKKYPEDSALELQACLSFCTVNNFPMSGEGQRFAMSDAGGIIPESVGSFREDRGLYSSGGSLYLRDIEIELLVGAERYTTILNLYNESGSDVIIENARFYGNGQEQDPPTAPSRESGGMHAIRAYGNGPGDTANTFGRLFLKNVLCDDFYSDCIVIRSIPFDSIFLEDVEVYRAARNGVTNNSISKTFVTRMVAKYNGWRSAPRSGYHWENDQGDAQGRPYGGVVIENSTFEENLGRGVKFDFRDDTISEVGEILIVDTVSVNNNTAEITAVGDFEFGLASTVSFGFGRVCLHSCTMDTFRGGDLANESATGPNFRELILSKCLIKRSFRALTEVNPNIPDIVDLEITELGAAGDGYTVLDMGMPGRYTKINIGTVYPNEGGSRLFDMRPRSGAPVGDLMEFHVGKYSTGAYPPSRMGIAKNVNILGGEIRNVDLRDVPEGGCVRLMGVKVLNRPHSTGYVRADNFAAGYITDCWLVNVMDGGGTPGASSPITGANIVVLRDNIVEQADGSIALENSSGD